jgi:hypothetical protein
MKTKISKEGRLSVNVFQTQTQPNNDGEPEGTLQDIKQKQEMVKLYCINQ